MKIIIFVLIGGAAGSLLRYKLNDLANNHAFPWGTLLVNLLGCFLAGLCWHTANQFKWPVEIKILIFTGFLGGLTTFSAYALNTWELASRDLFVRAICNVLANNVLGLIVFGVGAISSRWFLGLIMEH